MRPDHDLSLLMLLDVIESDVERFLALLSAKLRN